MAYKDSDELQSNENYALGEYSFRIERSSVLGSTNDKVEAICTKDGKNARKSVQIPSSDQMSGWYVEANGDTASVYVTFREQEGGDSRTSVLNTSINQPIGAYKTVSFELSFGTWTYTFGGNAVCCPVTLLDGNSTFFIASDQGTAQYHVTSIVYGSKSETDEVLTFGSYATVNGKTVYWSVPTFWATKNGIFTPAPIGMKSSGSNANSAYTMLYGQPSGGEYGDPFDVLIARFAIELEDAGGEGPGSDWSDPGDYDPDWEEGDPTHTLYVEVTGALSGRHNDPIVDPSYSYIPADKDTVKDYGCGGDGGHGGGGGAGASTVVIHKFATNQANSKEVTAIARRHGYGSGGGKGGKGGDGCILVYY